MQSLYQNTVSLPKKEEFCIQKIGGYNFSVFLNLMDNIKEIDINIDLSYNLEFLFWNC